MYMYWSRRNVQYRAVACDVAIVQPSVYEVSISLAKALPSRNDREMYSVAIGSVSEATYYRGQMYIDGAARKKDYRMMLCESDTHRHITVKHTLHVHRLRHMDKCARPDTKCDTVQQRSRTRMSHRCSCMGAACGALTPHRSAQGGTVSTCSRVQPASHAHLGCSLESSAPASPKAEAAAAIAIAAWATCGGRPRPAARLCVSIEGPEDGISSRRVNVER